MDYANLQWLKWRNAVFQPLICIDYVLDGLFDCFGEEIMSDDYYVRKYDDVGELSSETDHDNGSIVYRYSNTSDDSSYNVQLEEEQSIVLSM